MGKTTTVFLIQGIFFAGLMLFGVIAVILRNRKNQAIQEQAIAQGFTWFGAGTEPGCSNLGGDAGNSFGYAIGNELMTKYLGMVPFGLGSSRIVSSLCAKRGKYGVCYCFTYQYSTGSGKNRTTHYYSLLLYEGPYYFPQLCIRPQTSMESLVQNLGFRDIQLESAEFNNRWHISCADEKFAYAFIDPQMMEFIDDLRVGNFATFGTGMFFIANGTEAMTQHMPIMESLIEHIPGFVAKDHSITKPQRPLGGVNI